MPVSMRKATSLAALRVVAPALDLARSDAGRARLLVRLERIRRVVALLTRLDELGWTPDYLTLRRRTDLHTPTAEDLPQGVPCVALGAARLGRTRLIDNLEC